MEEWQWMEGFGGETIALSIESFGFGVDILPKTLSPLIQELLPSAQGNPDLDL